MKSEQKPKMGSVFVVATSEDTKGGISAVVSSYKKSYLWSKWNCVWIESNNSNLRFVPKLIYTVGAFFKYLTLLKSCRLVHIHMALGRSAFRKRFYFYAAKILRKPIILHLHSPTLSDEEAKRNFEKYSDLFVGSNLVLTLSPLWRDMVLSYLPTAKVNVLMNAVKLPDVISPLESRNNRILYLGILNARKGYADLLHSFSKVSKKFPNWKLELGGNGELNEALELCHKLGIGEQVVLHGWVMGEKKEQLLRGSKIYCLPSYAEGFPVSVLEALGYGIPVITTPVGGMEAELSGSQCVEFVEPGDVDRLADLLCELMASPEKLTSMSLHARKLAVQKFSYDQMIASLDSYYSSFAI